MTKIISNSISEKENDIRIFEPQDYIVIDLDEMIDLSYLGNDDYAKKEMDVIRLTNLERDKRGLGPLSRNENLSRSALLHTMDMAENRFISHQGSDGSDLKSRIDRIGYGPYLMVGENLAMGYLDPEKVVQGWMESPGHRENILKPECNEIGVAYIEGIIPALEGSNSFKGGYWTQHFGVR